MSRERPNEGPHWPWYWVPLVFKLGATRVALSRLWSSEASLLTDCRISYF